MSESTTAEPVQILLVEDNPGDVRLTKEAFEEGCITNDLHVVRDGQEALDYLFQRGDYEETALPDLILLDLNLPKVDGWEVLDTIKNDSQLSLIPVIILTGSEAEEDIVQGYKRHSNAYLTKPIDPDDFVDLMKSFEKFWLSVVEFPPSKV